MMWRATRYRQVMDPFSRKPDFTIYFGAFIFALAGIAIMFLAYHLFSETKEQLANTLRTQGEILAIEPAPDEEFKFNASVRFTALNGESRTADSYTFGNDHRLSKGDVVEIAYPTDGKGLVAIKGKFGFWFSSIAIFLFGSVFLSIGIALPMIFRKPKTHWQAEQKMEELAKEFETKQKRKKKREPTVRR